MRGRGFKIFNEFQELAFLSIADEVSCDHVFFLVLLEFYEKTYGLYVNSQRGLDLFFEVCAPEMKLAKEQCPRKDFRSLFSRYNAAIWNGDRKSLASVIAEVGELGVPGGAVDKSLETFWVSGDFIRRLEEFRKLLDRGDFEAARWFFFEANKKYIFSPIEFLAMKSYHIAARKIYFLEETNPEAAEKKNPEILQGLKEKIDHFLEAAREIKNFQPPKWYQIWRSSKKFLEWSLFQNAAY